MKTKEIFKQFECGLKAMPKSATLPILEYFYFNKGRVVAYDLEHAYVFSLPETQDIEAVIDGKKLVNTLKKLGGDQEVFFEYDSGTFVFTIKTSKGFKFTLMGANPEDYPMLPDEESKSIGRLSEDQTRLFFKAVRYAGKSELQPVMNTVYIDREHVVASDGYKLCYYPQPSFLDHPVMLSAKVQLLLESGAPYTVYESENWLQFHSTYAAIYMRKIEGEYFIWKAVIPESPDKSFICNGKDLTEILNLALGTNDHQCRFSCDEFGVEVRSQNIDSGSSFAAPLTDQYDGEALEIAFNPKLLFEILAAEKETEYALKLVEASRAMIINDEILLMPLMLSDE